MEKIEKFFDKFRNKAALQVKNHLLVLEILKKQVGLELEIGDIKISNGIVKVKTSQLAKNEIFIKKNKILKEISEKIQNQRISDIQ